MWRWFCLCLCWLMLLPQWQGLAQEDGTPLSVVRDYTGLSAWHAAGYTAQDVRIGIIDVGFVGADQLSTNLVIPNTVSAEQFFNGNSTHGTQVLEVLLALAPDAEFYLFQLAPGGRNIAEAVDWLLAQQVQVVNYSVMALDVPLNGDNHQSQQMGRLADANVVVVAAMGNYHTSYFSEPFRDSDGDGWHEFQWGYESVWAAPIMSEPFGQAHLRWQDDYNRAQYDLDLYVFDATGKTVLEAATKVQQGSDADWPYEDAFYPTTAGVPIYLAIRAKIPGTIPENTVFYLYADDTTLGLSNPEGALTAPADSAKVLSVGAIEANEAIWSRSGHGPTWDGRIKPDLVAPTRLWLEKTNTVFLGTSASTPVVTGLVAVLRGAYPLLTEAEIRHYLWDNAYDLGVPGQDNVFGYGRVWLPPPQE